MRAQNHFNDDLFIQGDKHIIQKILNKITLYRVSQAMKESSIALVVANLAHFEQDIIVTHFSNRHSNPDGRSLKTEKRVMEELEKLGLISIWKSKSKKETKKLEDAGENVSSYRLPDSKQNRSSYIGLTPLGAKHILPHVTASTRLVIRRERIGKKYKKHKRIYLESSFSKEELEVVAKYENLITELNNLVSKCRLTYTDITTGEIHTFVNKVRKIFSGDKTNLVTNKELTLGGRYYSTVSNMESTLRASTQIDGEKCVELDFKNCLPSIMIALLKYDISLLQDLYLLEGEEDSPELRQLVKMINVVLLGVTTESGLTNSLNKKFFNAENGSLDDKGDIVEKFYPDGYELKDIHNIKRKVLDRYRQLFPKIDKIIFNSDRLASLYLQNIESRITTRIIHDFVKSQRPILTIHDSYIVKDSDKQFLFETMTKAFIEATGQDPIAITNAVTKEIITQEYFQQEKEYIQC